MSRILNLQIRQRRVGPVVILDLDGEITLGYRGTALVDGISNLLEDGSKKLLLNLEGVTYVDSFGVSELVRAHAMSERAGGELKLVNLTNRVQSILQMTNLVTIFELFDGERDAIVSFARASVHMS
jgi:anti-sigma B factor antagonist